MQLYGTTSWALHKFILPSAYVVSSTTPCSVQWFESQLGGTQPIVPVHAFPLRHWTSSACILHQGRSATWADSQVHIPRAVCYNQSLKKKFLVVFWRSTYFYFEAHNDNLLRHPRFSSSNFQDPKWSGGQAGHWPAACAHSILPAVRSNPAGQQSNRSNFFQMNLKLAILKSNHRLSHYEKSELAWGESWRDNFVTHSVSVEWWCPLSKEPNPNMDFASTIIVDGQAQNWTKQLKYGDQQLQKFQVLAPHLLQIWTVLIQPSFNIFNFHFKHLSSDLICSVLIWPTC